MERAQRPDDLRHAIAARDGLNLLQRMISNLLDVSRLEQGIFSVELKLVDLAAVARDCARSMSQPDRPVEVRAEHPVMIAGDADRLRQALENVVSNAVRHTPDNVPVEVTIRSEPAESATLGVIEIVDHGPGIASDLLPHIFTKFTRSKTSGGLGIGLFLAHGIAAAHGGTLTVESELGKGTRFRFALPVLGPPPQR